MPIERNQSLVTVAGVNSWKAKHQAFQVRYDLVKLGVRSGAPSYNCVYLVDGQEFVLVATNAKPTGFIEDRKISLWPGVHRHHDQYGDGTMLVVDAQTQQISTWALGADGKATLCTTGKDATAPDA